MTPEPKMGRSAVGSLVVALTSRRERETRQVAVTPVRESIGLGEATTFTVVNAAEDAHLPRSAQGVQLLTTTRKVRNVPAGMFLPSANLSTVNVIRGS